MTKASAAKGKAWVIVPRKSVGPLRLDDTRQQIRAHLPGPVTELRRYPFAQFPEDRVTEAGIMVDYDPQERAGFIEFYGPLSPTFAGKQLLHGRRADVVRWLGKLDPGLHADDNEVRSDALGLVMSVSNERRIATLGLFRPGYYGKRGRLDISVNREGLIKSGLVLQFTYTRAEMRKDLVAADASARRQARRDRDVSRKLGIAIHYDDADQVTHFVIGAPSNPMLGTRPVIGRTAAEVISWFAALDPGLQADARTIASPRHGLRFEVRGKVVETVTLFADPEAARVRGVRPLRNEPLPERMAWNRGSSHSIDHDAANVYWTAANGAQTSIMRLPKQSGGAGGAATVVTHDLDVGGAILVVGGRIFFAAEDPLRLMSVPVQGGPATQVALESDAGAAMPPYLAADARHLFWISRPRRALMRKPLAGGDEVLLAANLTVTHHLVLAGKHVYFFGCQTGGKEEDRWGLLRVPCAGGALQAVDGWRGHPSSPVVHGNRLAWVITNEGSSHVVARPIAAKLLADPALLHADPGSVGPLAANRHGLYWAGREELFKLAPGHREPKLHMRLNGDVDSLIADDHSLYWTDRDGGVWRCPA